MGLHKPFDRQFVTLDGAVKTSGGSRKLAKGQFAIADLTAKNTKEGSPLVNSFQGKPKDTKYEFRLGEVPLEVSRSISNKSWRSLAFSVADVEKIAVDAPDTKDFSTDEFVIGYNGEDGTEITLNQGDTEIIDLCLEGKAMSYLSYPDGKANISFTLIAPSEREKGELAPGATGYNADNWTVQELVEEQVELLKRYTLVGNNKLTDYVDITVVNSNNPATVPGATPQSFYELSIQDNGDYSSLARVQIQYPDLDIKLKEIEGDISTYVTIGTSAPADFTKSTLGTILKGCEDCPAGYTELSDGFVYSISIEDDGTDDSANVELAIPGVEIGSVSRNGGEPGTGQGFYSAVTDDELTQSEIDTFLGTYPTAIIQKVSDNVQELCENATTLDTAWIEGDTCNTITETYTLRIGDTKCGDSRVDELNAAYEDITITEVAGSESGCMRTYETSVTTDLVCEECDEIYRDIFISEAPDKYLMTSWKKEDKQYDGTAKMGIKFKAKKNILSGNEQFRDEMDFIAEAVRLRVVGGYPTEINQSYNIGRNERFTVTILSIYEPPKNYGGNLREYEDMARVYFNGRPRHKGHNYAKWAYGEESLFEGTKQYVDYIVRIKTRAYRDHTNGERVYAQDYHVYAEVGKHNDVEDLLNQLATAAGLPGVQAYAKG